MASAERGGSQEDKSIWNSRLFKAGTIIAAVGVLLDSVGAAATGVLLAGIGWAWQKGNK
jgi:hypothetical protein